MSRTRRVYNAEEVRRLSETTIAYYDRFARAFWDATRQHDVSQNYAAFLNALEGDPPYSILDLGLAMRLPESRFDGIFANASLFHVPSQELPTVLLELFKTLKSRGVLFSSNPRGNNEEGLSDDRYACFFDLDTWRDYVTSAGFVELDHYYRPPGLPRDRQPWLATVWRKA